MKKYSKYKDSGIEWLGEIPEHWSVLKIGRSFSSIGSGTTPKSTNSSYYNEGNINWLNTGDLNDSYIIETSKKITQTAVDEFSTLKEYPIDSIVIALYGATIGKLGHLKIPTTTNQACCVISGSDKIQQRFLFYYFLAARDYIISLSYGGGQPNISQDLIRQLYIPTPINDEQKIIISFLDHKTTQIDTLIEKKEQLVEKLTLKRQAIINEAVTKGLNPDVPMKDSGIEWLGQVPEHWSISKLNYVSDIFGGATPKSNIDNYWEGEVNWVTPDDLGKLQGNIIKSTRRTLTVEGLSSCSASIVPKGSIILSSRAPIGHLGVLEIEACTNQGCKSFVPKDNMHNYYLYYYLLSAKTDLQRLGTGSTFTEISTSTIKNYRISLPPFAEQQTIVLFLDHKSNQIDILIEKINSSIDKLKLYRQSLISEAVTGKIDLRDWEQTDNK